MASIRDELRRWRHDRWLTQSQAAELLQVSLTTYSRWERGTHVPPYRAMQWLRSRIGSVTLEADLGRERLGASL